MAEKNVLAELAHWLECDTRTLETASVAQLNRIRKASRIVAELAKVKLNGVGWPVQVELADAYEMCRAIAAEGAGDGK